MLAVAYSTMYRIFTTDWKREEGQTMAEYGVILTVIAVGCALAFGALATGIGGTIQNVVGNL